jgi:hypothetical protein
LGSLRNDAIDAGPLIRGCNVSTPFPRRSELGSLFEKVARRTQSFGVGVAPDAGGRRFRNRSPSRVEPVYAPPKQKLKYSEPRPPPET